MAAATAVLRRVSVIAGGPGTGKTTTVARVLALLDEQAAAARATAAAVALAAPTGKAAARLEEAVRERRAAMPIDEARYERLLALHGTTMHRLLGFSPAIGRGFATTAPNRLPARRRRRRRDLHGARSR